MRLHLEHLANHLDTIQLRHRNVGNHKIDLVEQLSEDVQTVLAVDRQDRRVSDVANYRLTHKTNGRLIIYNQYLL